MSSLSRACSSDDLIQPMELCMNCVDTSVLRVYMLYREQCGCHSNQSTIPFEVSHACTNVTTNTATKPANVSYSPCYQFDYAKP